MWPYANAFSTMSALKGALEVNQRGKISPLKSFTYTSTAFEKRTACGDCLCSSHVQIARTIARVMSSSDDIPCCLPVNRSNGPIYSGSVRAAPRRCDWRRGEAWARDRCMASDCPYLDDEEKSDAWFAGSRRGWENLIAPAKNAGKPRNGDEERYPLKQHQILAFDIPSGVWPS